MSTSDSIVSSQTKQSSWRKSDTTWTLGLFGTAIGAGVLFFPIRAGFGGLIPILLMLVLAYPIAFYCHRALARLCLSGSNPSGNITETVEEHFGKTGGVVITFLYFFAICPLLWIYGVTITNTFMTFWENQLGFAPLNRGFVALFLLLLMAFVIWFGKDLMVKVMSYLVWPFIASLVLISLSLIPYWNSAVIDQVDLGSLSLTGHDGILITVWLGISIMVFSFNFSPIVSSFVVSKREEYEKDFGRDFTERKCSQIISRASMLMVAVVMFFAFSCLFTLSPANMAEAKAQNIPVLSYLANHFASMTGTKTTFAITLEYAASIIALVAIFKSFFGHYLGTLEGLMMGTRSGDVDFGAMSWVASQTNQSLGDLERVVNKESGLLGISGLSSDLRVLEKAWHEGHERAQLAIKTFVHRIARHIAGHAASLRRLDGIIFTGGIGENSSLIRRLVMEHLAVLGVEIDTEMNNRSNSCGERIVSSENARVICAVIPTNEEKMIALDAIHLGKVNAPAEFA
ncbi:threonine/serine transporter TdcC [Escherichia coli]|nr:threonine/serine transporter TdcC [Escherichia coli]EIG7741334.1 threonine/serine transporter TdcC [Escherichia coli]EIH9361559.1 threonine/serine transporter TdcC [Escherichia coli]ELL2517245.1 threonine/serine transporter TdcC [Escherichia coli]